jgi:hypothetical protein
MIRFLISSVLLIFLVSCAPTFTKGLVEFPPTKASVFNPYFANDSQDYIYKAKIDVYGRYFGGILVIKKTGDEIHRVVFTTEFGSKIFDFEYEGHTFTKNFVIPDFDKKIIVNTLKKDFKILTQEQMFVASQLEDSGVAIYKTASKKRSNYYFFGLNDTLQKIIHASSSKEKVVFLFQDVSKSVANKITINHQNIKLDIVLDYFKK